MKVKIKHHQVRDYSRWTGKLNIMPRESYKKIGGLDERFSGWGGEDTAFAVAMNTLYGPYKRLDFSIYHLWHPRIGPKGNPHMENNMRLVELYKRNSRSKQDMRTLLKNRK